MEGRAAAETAALGWAAAVKVMEAAGPAEEAEQGTEAAAAQGLEGAALAGLGAGAMEEEGLEVGGLGAVV